MHKWRFYKSFAILHTDWHTLLTQVLEGPAVEVEAPYAEWRCFSYKTALSLVLLPSLPIAFFFLFRIASGFVDRAVGAAVAVVPVVAVALFLAHVAVMTLLGEFVDLWVGAPLDAFLDKRMHADLVSSFKVNGFPVHVYLTGTGLLYVFVDSMAQHGADKALVHFLRKNVGVGNYAAWVWNPGTLMYTVIPGITPTTLPCLMHPRNVPPPATPDLVALFRRFDGKRYVYDKFEAPVDTSYTYFTAAAGQDTHVTDGVLLAIGSIPYWLIVLWILFITLTRPISPKVDLLAAVPALVIAILMALGWAFWTIVIRRVAGIHVPRKFRKRNKTIMERVEEAYERMEQFQMLHEQAETADEAFEVSNPFEGVVLSDDFSADSPGDYQNQTFTGSPSTSDAGVSHDASSEGVHGDGSHGSYYEDLAQSFTNGTSDQDDAGSADQNDADGAEERTLGEVIRSVLDGEYEVRSDDEVIVVVVKKRGKKRGSERGTRYPAHKGNHNNHEHTVH